MSSVRFVKSSVVSGLGMRPATLSPSGSSPVMVEPFTVALSVMTPSVRTAPASPATAWWSTDSFLSVFGSATGFGAGIRPASFPPSASSDAGITA